MRSQALPQSGLTLLEVLVALMVFGLVMAGLTGGLQFGLRAYQRQTADVVGRGDPAAVDQALRRLIERMEPPDRVDGPVMTGTARSFRFFSTLPDSVPTIGSRRIEVILQTDEHGALVLRWMPHPHARLSGPIGAGGTIVLLPRVGTRLSYLPLGSQIWSDDWDNAELPKLIRIHLIFPAGDARRWPDIIAGPTLV